MNKFSNGQMIGILFDNQYKKTAKFISEKLQKKGYETTLNVDFSQVYEFIILIFSQKSNKSEKIITSYNKALDSGIHVIPFVITDLEYNLTTDFFLSSHDWINAFDNTLDKATSDLITLITELQNDSNPQHPSKADKPKQQKTKHDGKKKQTRTIIAIILIFALIIGALIKINLNSSENSDTIAPTPIISTSSDEDKIIGDWRLANYKDNIQRTPNDLITFQQSIENLKKNFLLRFKKDGTFEKYGFAVPEKGNWQYDPQNKIIYMWPPGSQAKDVLKIEKLSQDTLIFSVATREDSLNVITTIFTLYK